MSSSCPENQVHPSTEVEIQRTVPNQGRDMLAKLCPMVGKENGPVQQRSGSPNEPLALPVDDR